MIAFITLFLGLVRGPQLVEVAVSENVATVEFRLDGEVAGHLDGEPWKMKLDLGSELSTHELVAVARDTEGLEVGRVAQHVNVPRSALEVWTTRRPGREDAGFCRGARHLKATGSYLSALARLRRLLKKQQILWVEGRHLPREIVLAEVAPVTEVVQSN